MVSASASFTGTEYYDNCLGPIYFDRFAADLVQRVPERPPGDVLEVAGGIGLVTKRLRDRIDPSLRLVATDLSNAMLDYARGKLGERKAIAWREADVLKLPFEDRTFGAVVPICFVVGPAQETSMWTHEQSIETSASPARAWQLFADVSRWKDWKAGIEKSKFMARSPMAQLSRCNHPGKTLSLAN